MADPENFRGGGGGQVYTFFVPEGGGEGGVESLKMAKTYLRFKIKFNWKGGACVCVLQHPLDPPLVHIYRLSASQGLSDMVNTGLPRLSFRVYQCYYTVKFWIYFRLISHFLKEKLWSSMDNCMLFAQCCLQNRHEWKKNMYNVITEYWSQFPRENKERVGLCRTWSNFFF